MRLGLINCVGATFLIYLLLSMSTRAEDIQKRHIKFGHFMNPGNPISLGANKFAALVNAKSGGKLKVRVFGAGQLGPEGQQQAALVGGAQEMTAQASSQLVGILPELGLLDFPFIVQTEEQADQLNDGPAGQALLAKLPERGLVALGYWENGFRHITNSKRPIYKLEDLSGLKIRVQPNEVFIETFKALNSNPVPMSFSELYTALETKAVDAQENPLMLIQSSRFYEVQDYTSLTAHAYGNLLILVSARFWDRLSPVEQRIFREAFAESQVYQRQESRRQAKITVAKLKAEGMKVNSVTLSEQERLRLAAQPVLTKIAANYDPEIVKVFFGELERIHTTP